MAVEIVHKDVLKDHFSAVCGEAITAGQLITIDPADQQAWIADASSGTEDVPAVGVATADFAVGETGTFVHEGAVRGLPACVDGYWYLSNTPGAFSATAGDTSQIVAWAAPGSTRGVLDFQRIAHNHTAPS